MQKVSFSMYRYLNTVRKGESVSKRMLLEISGLNLHKINLSGLDFKCDQLYEILFNLKYLERVSSKLFNFYLFKSLKVLKEMKDTEEYDFICPTVTRAIKKYSIYHIEDKLYKHSGDERYYDKKYEIGTDGLLYYCKTILPITDYLKTEMEWCAEKLKSLPEHYRCDGKFFKRISPKLKCSYGTSGTFYDRSVTFHDYTYALNTTSMMKLDINLFENVEELDGDMYLFSSVKSFIDMFRNMDLVTLMNYIKEIYGGKDLNELYVELSGFKPLEDNFIENAEYQIYYNLTALVLNKINSKFDQGLLTHSQQSILTRYFTFLTEGLVRVPYDELAELGDVDSLVELGYLVKLKGNNIAINPKLPRKEIVYGDCMFNHTKVNIKDKLFKVCSLIAPTA